MVALLLCVGWLIIRADPGVPSNWCEMFHVSASEYCEWELKFISHECFCYTWDNVEMRVSKSMFGQTFSFKPWNSGECVWIYNMVSLNYVIIVLFKHCGLYVMQTEIFVICHFHIRLCHYNDVLVRMLRVHEQYSTLGPCWVDVLNWYSARRTMGTHDVLNLRDQRSPRPPTSTSCHKWEWNASVQTKTLALPLLDPPSRFTQYYAIPPSALSPKTP